MEFTPKVSIVIPVFNGSNYLSEAIDSALAQTYTNIEVIVVNDGSDDEGKTEAIATLYRNKIRYFYKENGGVATALNLGIKKMTGEYFSWLSHDDVYYPHKIETQINFLNKQVNKNIALYSDYECIDRNSNFLTEKRIPHVEPEKLKYAIISSGPINGCTVLLPKNIFYEIGLFNENLLTTQDYDMWYRISKKYNFIHQREMLLKSRLHPEQGIETIDSNAQEMSEFYYRCLKEIHEDEMLKISGQKSITTVYSILAIKYKRRIVSKASLLSSRLAKQHLLKDDVITIGKNIFLIGYCDIVNAALRLLNVLGFNKPKKYSYSQRLKLLKKP
jgi:glycosyltransferase involved in cell wall biosynthesis